METGKGIKQHSLITGNLLGRFFLTFYLLLGEKEMATHSSILAWRVSVGRWYPEQGHSPSCQFPEPGA